MTKRIITALVGLPIFLGLLYKGGYYTDILVFSMIAVGIIELFNIMKITEKYISFVLLFFSLVLFLVPSNIEYFEVSIFMMLTLFIIYIKKFMGDIDKNREFFHTILKGLFIFFYVAIPLYHLVLLRNLDNGFLYLSFMFVIIWATDSFAYFTGMAFGKNKLAPLVSPKKTIEGSIGGSLCALILAMIMNDRLAIFPEVSYLFVGLIILALTIVSQLGDLFESSIKRIYNVKDSGKILPGHGGVLDRFDSTIFTAPVFYILINFFI